MVKEKAQNKLTRIEYFFLQPAIPKPSQGAADSHI
jgi:hypothetical protein